MSPRPAEPFVCRMLLGPVRLSCALADRVAPVEPEAPGSCALKQLRDPPGALRWRLTIKLSNDLSSSDQGFIGLELLTRAWLPQSASHSHVSVPLHRRYEGSTFYPRDRRSIPIASGSIVHQYQPSSMTLPCSDSFLERNLSAEPISMSRQPYAMRKPSADG